MRARKLIKTNPFVPQKCIHLIRDGRGYLNSKLKKQYMGVKNRERAIHFSKKWLLANSFAEGLKLILTSDQYITIKYEDFCDSPSKILKQLCGFIGVSYDDDMLNFRSAPHHNIGGNVIRFGQKDISKADQEWRKALDQKDLIVFRVIAGWLNYLYGYR